MRWTLLTLVLAAGAATALAPVDSARAATPSLRLVTLAPLTLHGGGFRAQERVRVTLTVRTLRAVGLLRSDTFGRFTYRPRTLIALDPCRGTIVVTAVGIASARRATWKRACRPPDVWP